MVRGGQQPRAAVEAHRRAHRAALRGSKTCWDGMKTKRGRQQRLEQRRRQARDSDEVAAVSPSAKKVLEVKWSEVGGQDECGG
jgi:hypothetical protein